jgi:feruloyl esterase
MAKEREAAMALTVSRNVRTAAVMLLAVAVHTALFLVSQSPAADLARAEAEGNCAALKNRTFGEGSTDSAILTDDFVCAVEGGGPNGVRFRIELPVKMWNGKILSGGGAGWNGFIADYPASASARTAGYVIVRSNGGHSTPDGRAFRDNPEAREDFAYRSVHAAFETAKKIVEEFYGKPAERAYFEGCSNGGREGLMQAIHYLDDYDGIVVRAPAFSFTRAFLAFDRNARQPAIPFPLAKAQYLALAVAESCDRRDGLRDYLVHDQLNCRFDPLSLLCGRDAHPNCLSIGEAKTAATIYAPYRLRDGTLLHTGWGPGGEFPAWRAVDGPGFWPIAQAQLVAPLIRHWMRLDPRDFDPNQHREAIDEAAKLLDTTPDLRDFFGRKRKLIMVNGTHDWAMSYLEAIRYFEAIGAVSGQATRDENMEFFLLPGVQHCGGGIGPDRVDLLAALDSWVEYDKRPSQQGIVLEGGWFDTRRPMCRYPTYAHYIGGDIDSASSFTCR